MVGKRGSGVKHGHARGGARSRLYFTWANMKTRCTNEKSERFKSYGARGIYVCSQWESFSGFLEWAIGAGYADHLQIDRIDNNGPYSPENCRWVTPLENARNKTTTVKIGDLPLTEVAERLGIKANTIYERMRVRGWSKERAISTPVRRRK